MIDVCIISLLEDVLCADLDVTQEGQQKMFNINDLRCTIRFPV